MCSTGNAHLPDDALGASWVVVAQAGGGDKENTSTCSYIAKDRRQTRSGKKNEPYLAPRTEFHRRNNKDGPSSSASGPWAATTVRA